MKLIPKVSIIVPVYNVEEKLLKCLDSLRMQTLDEIEILVLNDGSTDMSGTIAQEYVKKYPKKFQFYTHENMGLSKTRNRGINLAKGEYIGFVDSDDYVEKETYKQLYQKAKVTKADIVYTPFYVTDEYGNSSIAGKIYGKKDRKNLLEQASVSFCNKLFSKKILLETGEIPDIWFEDFAYVTPLLTRCEKITYMPKAFYHYVKRKDSIVAQKRNPKTLEMLKAWDIAIENSLKQYRDNIRLNIIKRIPYLSENYFLYRKKFLQIGKSYIDELSWDSKKRVPNSIRSWIEKEYNSFNSGIKNIIFLNGFGYDKDQILTKQQIYKNIFTDEAQIIVLDEKNCKALFEDPLLLKSYKNKEYTKLARYFGLKYIYQYGGFYIGDTIKPNACFDYLRYYKGVFAMLNRKTISEEFFGAVKGNELIQNILRNYWSKENGFIQLYKRVKNHWKEIGLGIKRDLKGNIYLPIEVTIFNIGTQENLCERIPDNNGNIKDGEKLYKQSALLQELEAEYWKEEIKRLNNENKTIKNSTSWKMTAPVRKSINKMKRLIGR